MVSLQFPGGGRGFRVTYELHLHRPPRFLSHESLVKGPRPSSPETGFKSNLSTSFLVSRPLVRASLKTLRLTTPVFPSESWMGPLSIVCARPEARFPSSGCFLSSRQGRSRNPLSTMCYIVLCITKTHFYGVGENTKGGCTTLFSREN